MPKESPECESCRAFVAELPVPGAEERGLCWHCLHAVVAHGCAPAEAANNECSCRRESVIPTTLRSRIAAYA